MKNLEPVVKSKSSFSVLFLRDDSSVVRFRLKPFWLKFFICLFFCFSAASGAAGYAAHYYWKKYNNLQRERSMLAEKLGENRRKLDEFAGIERIEAVLPRSSMSSVSVAAVNGNGGHNGESRPASSGPQNPESAGAPRPETPPATVQPNGTSGAPAVPAPQNGAQPSAPSAGTAQAAADPQEKKEHPALIDDLDLRQYGERRYNISFGLSNRDKQIRLNGRVLVAVSDKSGKRYEITQISRDALRFVINNYKKIITSFALPAEVAPDNISRLHLTVTAEDVPNITYSFPFRVARPPAPVAAPAPAPAPQAAPPQSNPAPQSVAAPQQDAAPPQPAPETPQQ